MSWTPDPAGPTTGADSFAGTAGADSPGDALAGNDTLEGAGGDDYLEGGDDDDSLAGGEGNDTLLGGAGDDTVRVGPGLDSLDGGAGTNVLDFSDATSGVEMVLSSDVIWNNGFGETADQYAANFTVAYGSQHGDTFFTGSASADSLFGQAGDDVMAGNDGNDTVDGGADNDIVTGEAGDDLLLGGAGDDTLHGGYLLLRDPALGEAAPDTDLDADTLDGGDGYDLAIINRGNATADLTFAAADTLTFDGILVRDAEVFAVRTGAGDDSLAGGAGDDTFDGGLGQDSFAGGAGDDSIDGGDVVLRGEEGNVIGVDRVSDLVTYETAPDAISFSLTDGSGLVAAGAEGTDDLVNIERVIGTAGADTMEMSWGVETVDVLMDGRGGDDWINLVGDTAATLDGGAGNDTLAGGFGADTILGGEGDDYVYGGGGDDSIVATPGSDTVEGGAGDDSIETGDDNDLVIWRLGDGNDTIDLGAGQDTLDLEGWGGDWTLSVDGTTATFTGDGDVGGAVITVLNYDPADSVVCFAEGTRIMTARGEVPVETLRAGDLVLNAHGGAAFEPVRWVGRRMVDIARSRARAAVAPVLVKAGALAPGVPHRDLRVSPEHALLIDGVLVPAGLLVDGAAIIQESWRRTVVYWHVELDAHGVLVAEGALAESYLDGGNRHFFNQPALHALHDDLVAERRRAAPGCAPVLAEGDAALDRIRLRVASRAGARQAM